MPGPDWIPGLSQLKSAVQLLAGDLEGAAQTQENFIRECPGVSQITSVVQLAQGDTEGAWETQQACIGTINNVVDGIPVIGHVKGAVHHMVGDYEGGDRALNAATRSTVVVASGAAAGLTTGGLAAIPAGIAAGAVYDVASTISGEDQGSVAAIKNAVENPSAGTVFDAIVVPVGDGLGGYSGGQIANKIRLSALEAAKNTKVQSLEAAKNTKIQSLENARFAKLEILEAMADGPGTSGEVVRLGSDINKITAEINALKAPSQYSVNLKKGDVAHNVASRPAQAGIPVLGYTDESTTRQERPSSIPSNTQDVPVNGEDALYHDSYVSTIITDLNHDEKKEQMRMLDNQRAKKGVRSAYKYVGFSSLDDLNSLRGLISESDEDPNRDSERNQNIEKLLRYMWLRLTMPQEFSYTALSQLNNVHQGYYHSLIRHMNEWFEFISIDDGLIERLSPLEDAIHDWRNATDADSSREARYAFIEARRQLRRSQRRVYYDLELELHEVQMEMHSFIQDNITSDRYLGRTINENGSEQLFFRVETRTGREKVMVVCLSNDRYNPVSEDDPRPVRLLITVFFRSLRSIENSRILERR